MKLNLTRNLTPIRIEAWATIDAEAERVRGQFMTLGSGQAMVYDQKRREAEVFMANQGVSPGEIPHLMAESTMNGISVFDQAVIYLTMSEQRLTVSPMIENLRLAAKAAVGNATNPREIYEAAMNIGWPTP